MSEMGIGSKVVQTETAADLNQAQNTAVLTHTFIKPATIVRYGVVCVTGTLPVALDVKLRKAPRATPSTFADISGSVMDGGNDFDAAGAIGETHSKKVGAQVAAGAAVSAYDVTTGDVVAVTTETAAGGTCTAQVFIEYVEHGYDSSDTKVFDI